jgi:secreted PhoX family phosphatase
MKNTSLRPIASLCLTGTWLLVAGASSAQDPSGLAALGPPAPPGFVTAVKPYLVAVPPEYSVQPLLSAADRLPRTDIPTEQYQMVGIPDGLGAVQDGTRTILYMNHELVQAALSEPIVGQPLNRGAIVSRLVLNREGRVLSGDRAYDQVYSGNTLVGAAADVGNSTAAFTRFCAGSIAYKEAGFDRPIYFAGEESSGAATFDGRGGLAVAIFENRGAGELHTLPKFGHFAWENTLVQPRRRRLTVLMGMEDGPNTPDNQLHMFVGEKDMSRSASVLDRNGLLNGKLYVFVSTTPGVNDEPALFTAGQVDGEWVEIPNAEAMTDVELESASDAISAFGFVRTEDGAFNPQDPDEYFFVTTGSGVANPLGALYRMELDRQDPTGPAHIELVFNANAVVSAGGDIAVSPDNIGIDRNFIMINEDGTANSRPVMAGKARDGSIWRLNKNNFAATRVAELFPPGRDANFGISSGVWETTGIIPAEGFGGEAWFVNVQAHSPTAAPNPNVVEDGQLVLMRRTPFRALTP